MQLDPQDFLRLVEAHNTLLFVDIEATGLRADYGSTLCVSMKPFGQKPFSYKIDKPGRDNDLLRFVKTNLERADAWVTYYGKGFDIPFLNTRLLRWGMSPIEKRPHIDMYYTLKSNILTSRRSQGHLLSWLGTKEEKMTVSASVWAEISGDLPKHMPKMVKRCESDVEGLEALYKKTKHLIRDIKR